MKPTILEVQGYFKGVTSVRDYLGEIFKLDGLEDIRNAGSVFWVFNSFNQSIVLWESVGGYATKLTEVSKADQYFIEVLEEIRDKGKWDKNPRPKWSNGQPAHSKFITQKSFEYRIDKGEFPIISLRPTAIKGGWHDIEAIYQKQTNYIEKMHPGIRGWWVPFVTCTDDNGLHTIGQTYGHTVKRYDLVNKLLDGMIKNPYGRRHIMNLWQEQQMIEDPKALVPCAYETLYSLSEDRESGNWYVDMTLNQRSQDFMMTASINPIQYVMLGLAICGHLSYHTSSKYILRGFRYNVQNVHIYDRHMFAIDELLQREVTTDRFNFELPEAKDFYEYHFEDFLITKPSKIEPLSKPLEISVL